jgi:hypothetical protein
MLDTNEIRSREGASAEMVTELTLSDRLIALAKDAERAGFKLPAERLVRLACDVFDEAIPQRA